MEGRCSCGALHYRGTAVPVWKLQCHCRECQYIPGGGKPCHDEIPVCK
ncbi:GFA family protein [Sulfitobacter sp. EhC04]